MSPNRDDFTCVRCHTKTPHQSGHKTNAIEAGMDYMGLGFSEKHDFVETKYYFPITHMVAPEEDSLACVSCHQAKGRLSALSGLYMPERDKNTFLMELDSQKFLHS